MQDSESSATVSAAADNSPSLAPTVAATAHRSNPLQQGSSSLMSPTIAATSSNLPKSLSTLIVIAEDECNPLADQTCSNPVQVLPDLILNLILERLPDIDSIRFGAVCRQWRATQIRLLQHCDCPSHRLPQFLLELILERLPLADYIKFAAVCRRWSSINKHHRSRYSPGPPPMLPLPWIIISRRFDFINQQQPPVICYSPFEKRLYSLPSDLLELHLGNVALASCNGWLILLSVENLFDFNDSLLLVNPLTGIRFELPPLFKARFCHVAMSGSPANENCFILAANYQTGQIFLLRVGESHWASVPVKNPKNGVCVVISLAGKFYCRTPHMNLIVIHPILDRFPIVQFFFMDHSQLDSRGRQMHFLAELDDKVLLLEMPAGSEWFEVAQMRVLQADLTQQKWVTMESLGDWMLLHDRFSCHSFMAADIGGKKNCVYLAGQYCNFQYDPNRLIPYKVFDLEVQQLTHGEILDSNMGGELDNLGYSICWIVPSLDSVNPARLQH